MYHGNDEARKNGMAHYHDLRETYAKHMEYHGCGFALFQPISAKDMTPPCAGYFDRNGDWNLICSLSTSRQAQRPLNTSDGQAAEPFEPLKYSPKMVSQVNIEWQPKTSQNTEAHVLSGGGQTPDNLPAGADVNIKYASTSKFGAVLMTLRPITLHAYNDERLFLDWLENNRAQLFNVYGPELKKYGMWVVTRTYNAPGCSINAWMDNSMQSIISLKAKANMLGELADGEMQWSDKAADKDWSHYKAQKGDAVVVFMDGIEVSRTDWYVEGVRQKFARRPSSSRSPTQSPQPQLQDQDIRPPQVGDPLEEQQRRASAYLAPPPNGHLSSSPPRGLAQAHVDVGVMPTWSEGTAGPVTHGGTRPRVERPQSMPDAGYLIGSPIQKKQARHNSGFGHVFTEMDAPTPWDPKDPDFETPVDGQAAQSLPAPNQPAASQAANGKPTDSKSADSKPTGKMPTVANPTLEHPVDEETLKDAGMHMLSRRSISVRRSSDASSRAPSISPSLAPSSRTAMSELSRTKSLRRETRSISGQSMHSRQESA